MSSPEPMSGTANPERTRRVLRGQFLLWMILLVAAVPLAFECDAAYGPLFALAYTLPMGVLFGTIGMIRPARWIRIPMTILTVAHLVCVFGLLPQMSL